MEKIKSPVGAGLNERKVDGLNDSIYSSRPKIVNYDMIPVEAAILGGIFYAGARGRDLLGEYDISHLPPTLFRSKENQIVADAINALRADGTPVDCVTVFVRLHESNHLTDAGGVTYLMDIQQSALGTVYWLHHAAILARSELIHLEREWRTQLPEYRRPGLEADGKALRRIVSLVEDRRKEHERRKAVAA